MFRNRLDKKVSDGLGKLGICRNWWPVEEQFWPAGSNCDSSGGRNMSSCPIPTCSMNRIVVVDGGDGTTIANDGGDDDCCTLAS